MAATQKNKKQKEGEGEGVIAVIDGVQTELQPNVVTRMETFLRNARNRRRDQLQRLFAPIASNGVHRRERKLPE